MAISIQILTIMLISTLYYCILTPPCAALKPPSRQPFALVAFEWPMSMCELKSPCNKTPPKSFRLHGVWPADASGQSLHNCTSEAFSASALKPIRGELLRYWPSYYNTENEFWRYQWEKHGSCSQKSVADYFKTSLALFKKMYEEIFKALGQSGIRPSNSEVLKTSYTIQQYYDAICSKLKLIPKIHCRTTKSITYFLEIRLCATSDLKSFQNCSRGGATRTCLNGSTMTTKKALFYLSELHHDVL